MNVAVKDNWVRYSNCQVPVGLERGYLYQNKSKQEQWKWKALVFEASSVVEAIELLLEGKVETNQVNTSLL